jgi:hypothetical protein
MWPYDRGCPLYCCKVVWPYKTAGRLYCTLKLCDLTTGGVSHIAVQLYCVTLQDGRSLLLYCCRSICISSKCSSCYLWHFMPVRAVHLQASTKYFRPLRYVLLLLLLVNRTVGLHAAVFWPPYRFAVHCANSPKFRDQSLFPLAESWRTWGCRQVWQVWGIQVKILKGYSKIQHANLKNSRLRGPQSRLRGPQRRSVLFGEYKNICCRCGVYTADCAARYSVTVRITRFWLVHLH